MSSKRSPSTVIENPNLKDAAFQIQNALSKHETLLLIGNCWVDYKGRASSKLEPGERILIIKGDGSVLVHRPTDYSPVNWQPPGCLFQTSLSPDTLRIRAIRPKPRETIDIYFNNIRLLAALTLKDEGAFSLYASEQDMQKAILADPNLIEPELQPITFEKPVEPGFIDIYAIDKQGRLVIIEIKNETAGKTAALQLQKYIEAVRKTTNRQTRGILVAPNLAKGVQPLLHQLNLEYKPITPQQCYQTLQKQATKRHQPLDRFLSQ